MHPWIFELHEQRATRVRGAWREPGGLRGQAPAGWSPVSSENTPSSTRISSPSACVGGGKRAPGPKATRGHQIRSTPSLVRRAKMRHRTTAGLSAAHRAARLNRRAEHDLKYARVAGRTAEGAGLSRSGGGGSQDLHGSQGIQEATRRYPCAVSLSARAAM